MSGILSGAIAGLSLDQTFDVVVGVGNNTGPKSFTFTMFGWCLFTSIAGPQATVYPDSYMGNLLTGNPGNSGASIASIWQSQSDSSTSTELYIAFNGYVTPAVNSIKINGVSVSVSGSSTTYDSTRNITRWSVSTGTSLYFGLGGSTVQIIIT